MTTLFHIADLHFGAEDRSLVDAFTDLCNARSPDLVVAAGDFTQGGRKREFEDAARFLGALDAPVVGIPGNHDVPVRALHRRFTTPWRRYERSIGRYLSPSHRNDAVHVESLRTARRAQWQPDWSLGRIGQPSLTRALDLLDDSPAATRVLTCHHPILAPGGNHGRARTARAGKSVETIAQSCDLVLTGHLHETFALPAEAPAHTCWFVGAGTTFSRRTRGETAGFNALEIGEDTIRITHYTAHPDRPEFMATDDWSLARGRAA
jgi:3',5'-cyclic AMP phosphodiesterase CpdA